MKTHIQTLLHDALNALKEDGTLSLDEFPPIQIQHCKDKTHGDFASNIAMMLAKAAKTNPRELAEKIVANIPVNGAITQVDIAGPGFINFKLAAASQNAIVQTILEQKDKYGESDLGKGENVLLETVSTNPTGPLHVGHGRHAAFGASLANILRATGHKTHMEYYVNDGGRQMNILAASVWLRYLENNGETITFPSNGYRGDYIKSIATNLQKQHGDHFGCDVQALFNDLPEDNEETKEARMDEIINRAKELLGKHYETLFEFSLNEILDDIKNDLEEFDVTFDEWFHESSLLKTKAVEHTLETLKNDNHVYEHEGALWFKATSFGDDKDRVLVRKNGDYTYFANDTSYHQNKMERGFTQALDIFGADHHGYLGRMKAFFNAANLGPERLHFLLLQTVSLFRSGEKIGMSTRAGEFVTLRELRKEVGNDAARYFYIMRRREQPLDFDLDLAKSKSNENPVFYIQYAHARICSVMQQLADKGFNFDEANGLSNLDKLTEEHEADLIKQLSRLKESIEQAAKQREPYVLAQYMHELANRFHSYYNAHQFIVEDANVRDARLCLIQSTRQVLANGLRLLGINAPESM